MKYTIDEVKGMVADTERKLIEYRRNAEAIEKMWALQPFKESPQVILDQDGIEAIATADPYNVIQLLMRFVAGEPRIEIPYLSTTDEDDRRSEKLEEFLTAYWAQLRRQAGRNLMQDAAWYSGVRGRGVLEVQWVGYEMPERLRASRTPVNVRMLDPLDCGFCYGPWGVDYAFHRYDTTRSYISQAYPDYELDDRPQNGKRDNKKYRVTSFYYAEPDSVWHCVMIDDKWAKEPVKTEYVDIPLIEWTGDGAPIADEAARSLSLLHPLKDLWPAKSRLVSRMSTMFLYYAEPIYTASNPKDQGWKQELVIKPGAVFELTGEQKLDVIRADANIPMATTLLQIIDAQIQQATFPSVMYGEEGGAASGYAINQLASSARGRINTIRMNLESAIERANELILSCIERFDEGEGVTVMGVGSEPGVRGRPMTLKASDIKGSYANTVTLVPEIPTDETQRLMTWKQLAEAGFVSQQFVRDRIMNLPVPKDEDMRVTLERAYQQMPELQQKAALAAIRERYKKGDQWRRIIAGTPLEQLNKMEEQWVEQQAAEKEAAKQAKKMEKEAEEQAAAMQKFMATGEVPKGWHLMPDGTLMKGEGMPLGGAGLPPLPPGMGPLEMPGQMPPGMPPEMQGPLPPELMGMLGGEPPPGMGGPGMPPDMGMPPGAMGPPGMPGMASGPGSLMTPEMMGIPPTGGPPGMFQEMQGQPLTDEEIARRLMGPGAGGPPPMR